MSKDYPIDIEKVIPQSGNSFLAVHYSKPYFAAPLHRHEEYELIYIEEGNGLSLVGDNIRKLKSGDFMLIGSNLPHLWLSSDEHYTKNTTLVSRSTYAQFKTDIFPKNIQHIPEMARIYCLLNESSRGLYFTQCEDSSCVIKSFMKLPGKKGIKRLISLYDILDRLATDIPYEYIASDSYEEDSSANSAHSSIHSIINYINCNYQEQITLNDIAEEANMHPAAICRIFKKSTGKKIFDYICELRINHATKLLVNSDLPIKRIAYDCGYNYISFFNKQFKALKKMSPTEYRAMFKRHI